MLACFFQTCKYFDQTLSWCKIMVMLTCIRNGSSPFRCYPMKLHAIHADTCIQNLKDSCFDHFHLCRYSEHSIRGSRGGDLWGGLYPPWKITKHRVFGNTGMDPPPHLPRKITKLPSQQSVLGHHQPTSETPFKWGFFRWRANVDPLCLLGILFLRNPFYGISANSADPDQMQRLTRF